MEPIYMFVYGTLTSGRGNHGFLSGSFFRPLKKPAEFIGHDEAPGIRVRDLTVVEGDSWVWGEVYKVTDEEMLAAIDRLEHHPHMYYRKEITLRHSGLKAWIYYIPTEEHRYAGIG